VRGRRRGYRRARVARQPKREPFRVKGAPNPDPRGADHKRLRAILVPAAHGLPCPLGCGRVMDATAPRGAPNKATLDHVLPLARGGSHDVSNYRVVCHTCNSSRGARVDWTPPNLPPHTTLPGYEDW
jgi:5-methylcytosine-specific restriction endonuclease McrA